MKQSVSIAPYSVSNQRNLTQWFQRTNSFCSSLMGEQVTHLQVLSALATFLFITLAVFTAQRDVFVTVLFILLAAFCCRGLEEKGGKPC